MAPGAVNAAAAAAAVAAAAAAAAAALLGLPAAATCAQDASDRSAPLLQPKPPSGGLRKPVRCVMLVVAMEQEAAPIIERFKLQRLAHQFLPGAPMVAWEAKISGLSPNNEESRERHRHTERGTERDTHNEESDLVLRLVWCGRDVRYSGNNVGTTAAAVACYAAVAALGAPDLVLSVGTAGGFAQLGARVCDVYLSTKCVYHARRIPESTSGGTEIEEYGIGHYRSPPLYKLVRDAGLKAGVVSTSDSLDSVSRDMELMLSEGAAVKEMEAAAVAWVCKQLGIPFAALKSITDLVDEEEVTVEVFEANLDAAAKALMEKLVTVLDLLAGTPLEAWASAATKP